MFNCDLHIHLGGSISKGVLVEFANSDNHQKVLDDIDAADVLQMFKTDFHKELKLAREELPYDLEKACDYRFG